MPTRLRLPEIEAEAAEIPKSYGAVIPAQAGTPLHP
jgi:hypothetical protein